MIDRPVTRGIVRRETYRDSVELMRIAVALQALPGIEGAAALMATPANRALLEQAGFVGGGQPSLDGWAEARPTDLLVVVRGAVEAVEAALELAATLLAGGGPSGSPVERSNAADLPRTLREAVT